ncbi:MAG: tRNA 2-thiouridine(34) synthase MnmA [Candidatus Cloacimonetes bacterium]|jgi:tRNA-specific 2-thiouridylase|nr:tRNA 2-thiouridine(34) synthase MnmA [Candidatus Cloacimonadota bacterium]MDD2507196.1 tRNA 2-thiouridine(34) synthase MnmA [Candidatus Cloacimonadota bacterium]MDD4148048.1 tRNA 2-thiouridine(34) synthase MnmA [Candidatus Cloacimonadota bacterium]MDD4560606.1 tRNA 2-thiouridine(34) synthase MnmA [Candidatus Cloacimonadota bacterium]
MKIALGMSGGIDSSMCALMLKEQGHEVIGVTMAKWSPASGIVQADKRGCFGPSEPEVLEAARRSAQKLGIEHHIINLEREFKDCVLDYYVDSYLKGLTPNPCIICNRRIKFDELIRKTKDLGVEFDCFATGHYARIRFDDKTDRYQLLEAKDKRKDQSYFLSMLSQQQLAILMFPLGEYLKEEIKAFATSRGYDYLIKKKESQDFLESVDNSPLFATGGFNPGDFVDKQGKILGRHSGLIHYTIGQRKGLGLAGFARPQYVIGIDYENNRVIIGEEEDTYSDTLYATEINWLSIAEPKDTLHCTARIRLAHKAQECVLSRCDDGRYLVQFICPVSAITPGQVVAFYRDELVLGAGFIAG